MPSTDPDFRILKLPRAGENSSQVSWTTLFTSIHKSFETFLTPPISKNTTIAGPPTRLMRGSRSLRRGPTRLSITHRVRTERRKGLIEAPPGELLVEAVDESALVQLADESVVVEILRLVLAHLARVEELHRLVDAVDGRIGLRGHLLVPFVARLLLVGGEPVVLPRRGHGDVLVPLQHGDGLHHGLHEAPGGLGVLPHPGSRGVDA